jgi:SAM-dependent methyltransferase
MVRGLAVRQILRIAKELYPVCFEVDRAIGGHPPEMAAAFARGNAMRHARTVQILLDQSRRRGKGSIRVINASGLSAGHQDFSVVGYLRNRAGISVDWTAFESPRSPYMEHIGHRERADRLGIRIILSDFTHSDRPYGDEEEVYDVGIFTEVAEHLDHSVLLQALKALHGILREDGVLLLTTPNMVSLPNRLRVLRGNGDGPYFGDGQANLEAGLYGHIALYDARRMERLLRDVGFRVLSAETFNSYFLKSFRDAPREWLAGKALDLLAWMIPNGGGTLLVLAGKGDRRPVSFAT